MNDETVVCTVILFPLHDIPVIRSSVPDLHTPHPQGYLEEYNSGNHGPRMDLVLFTDAIEHVSRICRVLRQPR